MLTLKNKKTKRTQGLYVQFSYLTTHSSEIIEKNDLPRNTVDSNLFKFKQR